MLMAKSIVLTGASGFVGSRFRLLNNEKYLIRTIPWEELSDDELELDGIEVVVHMAALNHRMGQVADEHYVNSNFKLSKTLGEQAKACGVGHFVFLSTVKVYGETNIGGKPFTETDSCHPVDAYGKSKLDAENALKALESDSFKVSIIRSPLVYGPGVKGNMERLIKLAATAYPLGFKGIENERTMVFVDNLIALVDAVINSGQAGVFLAGDDHPISTSDAVSMIRKAMGKNPKLFQTPKFIIDLVGLIVPKLKTRLFDSLLFDNSATKKQLNFHNPFTTEEGFKIMVATDSSES